MKATLFNIQRFSLHDGPGIRTTVFFKGCNMRCAWCHNPESFTTSKQLSYDKNKCIGCRACEKICPVKAHIFSNNAHTIDTNICTSCMACVDSCPVNALTVIGEDWEIDDIVDECLKDIKYYSKGNGGVTFSGGEASLHFNVLLELSKRLKEHGIHTCIETNGAMAKEKLVALSETIDLFLFDFKLYDDELHQKYVGLSNKIVYDSLATLHRLNQPIILRCPIIPNINDNAKHFDTIRQLRQMYNNIIDVEIMTYHNIGASKWEHLNIDYSLLDTPVPSNVEKLEWEKQVK